MTTRKPRAVTTIRMSDQERARLEKIAIYLGVNPSNCLRQLVDNKYRTLPSEAK